jgi:hypothetical protein
MSDEKYRQVGGIFGLVSHVSGAFMVKYTDKQRVKKCAYLDDTYIVMPKFGASWPFKEVVVDASQVYFTTWGKPLPKDAVIAEIDVDDYKQAAHSCEIHLEQRRLPGYKYLIDVNKMLIAKLESLGYQLKEIYEESKENK